MQPGVGGIVHGESKRLKMMKDRWHSNVRMDTPVPLLDADVDDRLLAKVERLKRADAAAAAPTSKSMLTVFPMLGDAMDPRLAQESSSRFFSFLAQARVAPPRARSAGGHRSRRGQQASGAGTQSGSDCVKDAFVLSRTLLGFRVLWRFHISVAHLDGPTG